MWPSMCDLNGNVMLVVHDKTWYLWQDRWKDCVCYGHWGLKLLLWTQEPMQTSQYCKPKLNHKLTHWIDWSRQHHHNKLFANVMLQVKCVTDLEGLQVWKRRHTSEAFAAGLLKEVQELEEKSMINRAYRLLRKRLRDDKPPQHLILNIHHGCLWWHLPQDFQQDRCDLPRAVHPDVQRPSPWSCHSPNSCHKPVISLSRFRIIYPVKL